MLRSRRLSGAVNAFESAASLRPPERLLTVRYESFTRDPATELATVCGFLGLGTSAAYLEGCSGVIQSDRPGERSSLDWSDESIASVLTLIQSVPFLSGYQWQ